MARSDLLVSLVRAGAAGDRREVTTAVEAIIAEERAKQHNVLADRSARERSALGTCRSNRGRDHRVLARGARGRTIGTSPH